MRSAMQARQEFNQRILEISIIDKTLLSYLQESDEILQTVMQKQINQIETLLINPITHIYESKMGKNELIKKEFDHESAVSSFFMTQL